MLKEQLLDLHRISEPRRLAAEVYLEDLVELAAPEYSRDDVTEILQQHDRLRCDVTETASGPVVAFTNLDF